MRLPKAYHVALWALAGALLWFRVFCASDLANHAIRRIVSSDAYQALGIEDKTLVANTLFTTEQLSGNVIWWWRDNGAMVSYQTPDLVGHRLMLVPFDPRFN